MHDGEVLELSIRESMHVIGPMLSSVCEEIGLDLQTVRVCEAETSPGVADVERTAHNDDHLVGCKLERTREGRGAVCLADPHGIVDHVFSFQPHHLETQAHVNVDVTSGKDTRDQLKVATQERVARTRVAHKGHSVSLAGKVDFAVQKSILL